MGCPATCISVLGEVNVWGLSRLPFPAVGIMTFIDIPFYRHTSERQYGTVCSKPSWREI